MPLITLTYTLFYAGANVLLGLMVIRLLSFRHKPEDSFPLYAVIASGFLLGQGILANVWLLLGLVSLFKSFSIWGILIMAVIAATFVLHGLFQLALVRAKITLSHVGRLPLSWKLLVALVILLILHYGIGSIINPPSGDAEAFYMVFPKIMAASERLIPQPNYYDFSQIGLFGEMHYAALMSIGNPYAAKCFVWFTSVALAVLLVSLCARTGLALRGQIIALIMLFTSSTFTYYITDGKVDLFGGALGIAAYYWALHTSRDDKILPYILTGLFTGFACIAKFSNIPVITVGVGAIVIWNAWLRIRLEKDRPKTRHIAGTAVGLILLGSFLIFSIIPHLTKNGVLFGEPFAPFLFLNGSGNRWVDQAWFSPETTEFLLLTYPLGIVFGRYPMQGGNISALVLAFTPLFFLLRKPVSFMQSRLFQITMIAIAGVITWTITRPAVICPRYILSTLLLFIPLAARSAENLFQTNYEYQLLNKMVYFSLLFSLFLFLNQKPRIHDQVIKLLKWNPHECEKASGYYNSLTFLNKLCSPGSRVYFGGYYSYFLRADLLQCMCRPDDYGPGSVRTLEEGWGCFETSEERWEYLFNRGFNYLLIQKASHRDLLQFFNWDNVPSWLTVKQIYSDSGTIIYSLHPKDSIHNPQFVCMESNAPAWDIVEN